MFNNVYKNCNGLYLHIKNIGISYIKRNYSQVKRKYPLNTEYINEIPVNEYVKSPHKRNRVYVWGNVRTGALGIPHSKKMENTHQVDHFKCPKRMHFAEKNSILQVATGFGFTLFATENKVYGSGLNGESQIGYHEVRHDKPLEILFAPQPIYLDEATTETCTILKISSGRGHSAVLTDKGLFLFGNNAYGQCGRMIVENEKYIGNRMLNHVKNIDGKMIVDVLCGQDHSLVILEDGSVYGCGWGADGQTGLEHFNCVSEFTQLNGDISGERITQLACRSDFVLAINDKNDIFGWGNTEYSQMILSDGAQQVARPTHLSELNKLGKFVSVATGGSFCSALTDSGDVYIWGFGLLGLGPQVQEARTPLIIPRNLFGYNEFNDDVQVVSVHAGLSHMAAITNKGDLYTWGRNRSCCLGLGFDKDQYFPLKVAIGGSVKEVSCGFDHMVAICSTYVSSDVINSKM